MVAAWVAALPCVPRPPLSGGIAVAVTAASLPALLGQCQAYRRTSVLSSCLIRGAMSQSHHEDPSSRLSATTLLLMVGLPGSGKTTRAKELAATHRALRLTPDEWMIPLFGDSMAGGRRFVLEGRLISVALQALRLGTSVVLDYGL